MLLICAAATTTLELAKNHQAHMFKLLPLFLHFLNGKNIEAAQEEEESVENIHVRCKYV